MHLKVVLRPIHRDTTINFFCFGVLRNGKVNKRAATRISKPVEQCLVALYQTTNEYKAFLCRAVMQG